jgi:hypothetical protein
MEIQGIEGFIKPVINHSTNRGTIQSGFGGCRSTRKIDGIKIRRTHPAVDLYGPNCNSCNNSDYIDTFNRQTCSGGCSDNTQTPVYAPYYGTVIARVNNYFPDQCTLNPNKFEETCPANYTCTLEGENYYCKNGNNKFYLPSLVIKHIDGSIGVYAEFYIKNGLNIGREIFFGERIGYLSQYTDQCHTELYIGTTNGAAWILGGHPDWQNNNFQGKPPRNLQRSIKMNNYVKGDFSKQKFNTIINNQKLPDSNSLTI